MTSITTWLRLEPVVRGTEMRGGLQARIYDPLWLLARQWQVGEFQGQDAGSPAVARWRGEAAPLTSLFLGPLPEGGHVEGQPLDSAGLPLETIVERERVRHASGELAGLRFAADAGQQFLRLLARRQPSRNYRDAILAAFPFAPLNETERTRLDPGSLSFAELVLPRVPDGRKLYAALRPPAPARGGLPPSVTIAAGDATRVQAAVDDWLRWYETLFAEPDGEAAWWSERLEYTFSVAAPTSDGERVLTAPAYLGGRLDWHDFSLNPEAALHATSTTSLPQLTRALIPAPVSYRGMPAPRFWAFEDARVDFGALDAGPEDLARLLLIEFALTFGGDWFVLPVELPVGSLCRTTSLVVTSTFGERFVIPAQRTAGPRHNAWRMFTLSPPSPAGAPQAEELFLLPPTLVGALEGRPIEEVLFLRDEMANMAWGIEQVVESAIERPLRCGEPAAAAQAQVEGASEGLTYRLMSGAPAYWVPLLPVLTPAGPRLRRARMLDISGEPQAVGAQGRILGAEPQEAAGLSLFEEELPREGVRVSRSYQLARWHDGSTHLWVGRRKAIGRGEGSSGLRFDQLEPGR